MGLFTGLLTLPLAPVRGVVWIGEQIQWQAEQELNSPESVSRRLAEIEAAWEAGQLSDDRRAELEAAALRDLLPTSDEDW